MIPVTHLLVVLSLCTALPTFCMEAEWLRALGRRHEGRDLLRIKSVQQIEPLIGQVIACRKDRVIEDSELWNNPPCYGFVERTQCYGPHGQQPSYFLRLYCIRDEFSTHGISDQGLAHQNWLVRLLTLDEVRCLSWLIKEKEISPHSPANGQFTVGNLIPEEQIKYFRQQASKQAWAWQRLLLLGHKDPESPLNKLPKDLIRSLMRYTLDGQVQQLRNNAKLGDVLEL